MELVFTRAIGDRFLPGEVRDYPRATWNQIARSAGVALDKFTRPVVEAAAESVTKKKAS